MATITETPNLNRAEEAVVKFEQSPGLASLLELLSRCGIEERENILNSTEDEVAFTDILCGAVRRLEAGASMFKKVRDTSFAERVGLIIKEIYVRVRYRESPSQQRREAERHVEKAYNTIFSHWHLVFPVIEAVEKRVQHMEARTPLERLGKAFVLYRLNWAKRILTTTMSQWGYAIHL